MRKKVVLLFLVIFLFTGCQSKSKKVYILKEHLDKLYDNYNIIDNCSYSNAGGDDELESIVKVDEDYILSFLGVDSGNYYSENKLVSYEKYNDMIMVGETKYYYNESSSYAGIVVLVDDSIEYNKFFEYITDIALNYSDSAINDGAFGLDIYRVKTLDRNEALYKEFVISQAANRCKYDFYKKYKRKIGIINEFEKYHEFLPTKLSEGYKDNYKEYIKETINEMEFY